MPAENGEPPRDSIKERIKGTLRLGRALRLLWQSGPRWTVARAFLVLVQAALPVTTVYLLKLVLDAVASNVAGPGEEVDFGHIGLLIGLLAAVSLLSSLLRAVGSLISEIHAQVVTDFMTGILHAKSVEADVDYYENPRYFDTLHRAQREASFRPTSVLNNLVQVALNGTSLLFMAGLLFTFHWAIAAVLFVAILPGFLVRLKYSREMYRWERKRTATERRVKYFDWLLTSSYPAKEVRLFDLGALFMGWYRKLRRQLVRERVRISSRRCLWESTAELSAVSAIFGSYAFVAYRTLEGAITIGSLVMYYQALQRAQGFLRSMLTALASLYEDNLFLFSLDEFLDLEPRVTAPANPKPLPSPLRTGITFDHVDFRYPSGTRKVLQGVTLTLPKGGMIALVGENGSGKTTVVKLLCRLYDPSGGSISIDGVDLRKFDPSELRSLISVVFQEYGHYHVTASENIWFGDVKQPADGSRIEAAARLSGADGVIARLPNGYDTILGKLFGQGEELSIGEWQKIALARAYLRDAEILVLDEPTSALDAKAEYEIFSRLRELTEDKTTLVISHRFSTVRMADHIYVMHEGRIAEGGTHKELVDLGGRYARLFETQARYYR